jgi:tight adherence protein B
MNLPDLSQIGPAHIFYASLVISGVLFVEAAYVLLEANDPWRRRINRRMMASENNSLSQKDVLVQLRKERGLDAEGKFILPVRWMNRLIVQAGIKIGIGRAMAIWALFSLAAPALTLLATRSLPLAAAALPVFGLLVPYLYLRIRRSRKMNEFGRQLPEAIDLITRSLKAGHPVPVAISMVAREMPDPIGSEFGMIADEVTYGSDLVTALLDMYERVGHPDLPLLVSSVSIQSTTGGNLREILGGLSQVIRGRLKMKAKIRAISAEGRISAIFLTALPIMLVIALLTIVPGYYRGIWEYSDSYIFAGGLLFWLVAGNLMILKLVSFRI